MTAGSGGARRAVVLLSGGLDSCVTAAIAARDGWEIWALHVRYGQRTDAREFRAFGQVAEALGIDAARQMVASIAHLAATGGSSLTNPSIAVSDANMGASSPPTSYVPFRNANLLAIGVSWAETIGASRVYIGAVAEDSSGYPDCRPEFYAAFGEAVRLGTVAADIRIETPVIAMDKAAIIRQGMSLGAPLACTWSCYRESEVACGTCDSCALRLRGFQRAGIEDPIPYVVRPTYA